MTRSTLAALATLVLLLLTLATWRLAEAQASAAALAGLALLKVFVIGAVFLELDRAWPVWALGVVLMTGAVAGGAVLLMGA